MRLPNFFRNKLFKKIVVVTSGSLLSLSAFSSEEECISLFNNGDFDKAYLACSALENSTKNYEVLDNLGHMYLFGKGTLQNNGKAIAALNKASLEGSAKANYILSQLYQEGSIVAKDEELSDYFRHEAIELGFESAVVAEIEDHYRKNSSDKSPKAIREFNRLKKVSENTSDAKFMLAECYRTGYGIAIDLLKAEELYKQIEDSKVYLSLGKLYEAKDDIDNATKFYQEAIANCSQCAGEASYRLGVLLSDDNYLQKAIVLGYYDAELELGKKIVEQGHLKHFNEEEWLRAEDYLNDGCSHEIKESCVLSAQVYFRHLPNNPEKTAAYFARLISVNISSAYELLGQEYLRCKSLPCNESLAFEMYRKAYELGNIKEPYILGNMYLAKGDSDNFRNVCKYGATKGDLNCKALLSFENIKLNQNVDKNIAELTTLAENNNGMAAFKLFKIYQSGINTERNHDKAFSYLILAADLDNPDAIRKYFGYLMRQKNFEEANKYLAKALAKNYSFAKYLQGMYLLKTEPNNLKKALSSFNEALEDGSKEALIQIGKIYENEHFYDYDYFKSCSIYEEAIHQGIKDASIDLAHCLVNLHNSDGRYVLPYIEKAASLGDVKMIEYLVNLYSDDLNSFRNDRELVRWVIEGSRLGITDCLYRLGELYLNGLRDILDQNELLGKKYLMLAMEQGSSSAAWALSKYFEKKEQYSSSCNILERFIYNTDYAFAPSYAMCYLNGVGRHKDIHKGEEILLKAYKKNPSNEIAYLLGQLYSNENSDSYNLEKAIEWFVDAVDLGDTSALYDLGCIYEIKSPFYSLENAFYYFSKAMETGNMAAELKVAEAYFYGRGVKQDYKKGCDLAEDAVSYAISDANPLLARCYLFGQGRDKDFDKAVATLHDGDDNSNSESSLMLAELYSSGKYVDPDYEFACNYYYRSVISSETLDQVIKGAEFFFPGKLCYASDQRTFVVLSIYQYRYNTVRYQKELLKIRSSLKNNELSEAKELLEKFMESDNDD